MHQGSALSPLLFVIVTVAVPKEFIVVLPQELLYTNNLIMIAENDNVENRGIKVNMNKTKVMISGERQ